MPENSERTDVGQLWRDWLTESERQWNGFFNDVMGTDAFGRLLGGYMEVYSTLQRLVAQNMERSLSNLNVPTRSDFVELSERLTAVEERLSSIDASLRTLAEAAGQEPSGPATVTQLRPRRTRRPRTQPSESQ